VDDEMWELEAAFDAALRAEQEGEAAAIVAAARATATMRDRFRAVAPGEVVTVVTLDGVSTTGRVLEVGADVVTIGETPDPYGRGRLSVVRVHDVALNAVVRVMREWSE
jgi:hypothetical protein